MLHLQTRPFVLIYTLAVAALLAVPASTAQAATISWVDFSGYVVGAQSQGGLSSASGLQAQASFSNLDNFNTVEIPSPTPASATIADASWPFENTGVSGLTIVPNLSPGSPPMSTQLTIQFTNPGGLPAGGSLAVMDLEFGAEGTVAIAGIAGGAVVPVGWSFASYSVLGGNVSPPLWNPLTATLSGPGDLTNPSGFPNNFALLTSDRALDAVVFTISAHEGIAFGVGQAIVPEPGAGVLIGLGLAGIAVHRRSAPRTSRDSTT